jgi:FO synthase
MHPDSKTPSVGDILARAKDGIRPASAEAYALAGCDDIDWLGETAAAIRDSVDHDIISYSRKIFIPLTKSCRDSCHYCTFAAPPGKGKAVFLSAEEVLELARAGLRAGCKEALFTLGDKPELRYRAARAELERLGHRTTLSYLAAMAGLVLRDTGLLPHLNPGVMSEPEIEMLRKTSVSMGIMLETAADRLSERGGPHFGSPDKRPAVRLETIAAAGRARVPLTSGLLIGIGETRRERIEALLALRAANDAHGHLQEIIIQNFKAKAGTRMARAAEPSLAEHLWTISVARILFGPQMVIQAPPNLQMLALGALIGAGINDFGGISPVTPDHVNPEAPWPHIDVLTHAAATVGKVLTERLALHPAYLAVPEQWLDPSLRTAVRQLHDGQGLAKVGLWCPGAPVPPDGLDSNVATSKPTTARQRLASILRRAAAGEALHREEIVDLFAARGADFWHICETADGLRAQACGDSIGYVVNRNINYTNICSYRCQFCAFSKGKTSENLRGKAYRLELGEIAERVREAWARGATEVCLQGGIHPDYTGDTYRSILRAVKQAAPAIHVHAFSPLEIWQGAATLGLSLRAYLQRLKGEGLGSLPGTAAEILDDSIRQIICPDKLTTQQWLEVVETAHRIGLSSTATIMFGHVDHAAHWADHLLHVRALQMRTGGFTEFVPLPFVPMETPLYLKGRARRGPSLREAVLMHAIARLVLHRVIPNIQVSWVKMGTVGAQLCLQAGANDFGGTLMNETISRAAGASHGQEMAPAQMEAAIASIGRRARPRTTLYRDAPAERIGVARSAAALVDAQTKTLVAEPAR